MNKNVLVWLCIIALFGASCQNTGQKSAIGSNDDFSGELTKKEISDARLTPEILWKFGRVADMQLSPDGKTIIYNVTHYNVKTNKRKTWIYSVPANGGEAVNLTPDETSCTNPRWVGNDKIAYLSGESGTSQIWIMEKNGSDKTQVSKTEGDINGFEFSGMGNKLFYLKDVKLDTTTHDIYPDLPLATGRIITDLMYRHWDAWSDYSYSHIFIASFTNNVVAEGTDIMKGEQFDSPLSPYFDISEISWSPDGTKLAYTCKKLKGKAYALSTNSDIYVYDTEKGTTTDITEENPGYDKYPVFSPDSRKIAYQSMATPGFESDKARLFVYDLDAKTKTYLTENLDQSASNFVWNEGGDVIYFISGINATYQVYKVNVATKEISAVTKGVHDYTSLALANNVMTGTKMSMSMATEVFRINPETGVETQVTFTNKNIYDAIKMGDVKERWVKTTDGKSMLVWVILPPNFDANKKYPALLYCQGGPQSAVSQFFSYRWNFQIMAANDYVIVAPNRRGLPTFGQAWNDEISGDYGGQNIKDYLSAIDDVKKDPYVDENRLGAVGASYGGYSVFYLAGHHNKRFKAFIAHCGIFNLQSMYGETEEMFFVNHDLGGPYWQNPTPKSYTDFSPHLAVDKWDTPIMIVTGANDFRIPYTQSLEAFDAAQLRGIPSELLFYPDESHFVSKPQNSILWQREFFKWLDKWLK